VDLDAVWEVTQQDIPVLKDHRKIILEALGHGA
jgi:hypothetical protein